MALDYRNKTAKRLDELQGEAVPCGGTLRDKPAGIQARLSFVRERLVDVRNGLGQGLDLITGPSPEVACAQEHCHDTVMNLISSIEDITDSIHNQVKALHDNL